MAILSAACFQSKLNTYLPYILHTICKSHVGMLLKIDWISIGYCISNCIIYICFIRIFYSIQGYLLMYWFSVMWMQWLFAYDVVCFISSFFKICSDGIFFCAINNSSITSTIDIGGDIVLIGISNRNVLFFLGQECWTVWYIGWQWCIIDNIPII